MSKKLEDDKLGKSYPFLKVLHKTSYSVVARLCMILFGSCRQKEVFKIEIRVLYSATACRLHESTA
jgi:hypothetical protein